MLRPLRVLGLVSVVVFAFVAPLAASAITISAVGQSFQVDFDGNVNGSVLPGLTSSARFDVITFTGSKVVLDVALSNTTSTPLWQSSRVSALGFDASAPISSASTSGLFTSAVLGGKFPNNFGPVDLCVISNPNNCSGGGSAGVLIGQTGHMTITMNFAAPITQLDLTNFGVRYQSLTSMKLGIRGGSGTGGPAPAIPEPSAVACFAVGLLVLGLGVGRLRAPAGR